MQLGKKEVAQIYITAIACQPQRGDQRGRQRDFHLEWPSYYSAEE